MLIDTQWSELSFSNPSCSSHQELIDDIWWKAASLVLQEKAWNEDLLMSLRLIRADEIESWNFEDSWDDKKSKILRGSASWDERWLVDAIHTKKGVKSSDLQLWIHKKVDTSQMNHEQWNPLAYTMYQNLLWLPEIARKLGIDVSHNSARKLYKKRQLWYYNDTWEVSSSMMQLLIEEHIKDSDVPYVSPFFMSQAPLWIEFTEDDIHMLEYGESSNNPLFKILSHSRSSSVLEYAKRWDGLSNYSWLASAIIQDIANGKVRDSDEATRNTRGSVIEHPNLEWHYLVNIIREENGRFISQFLVDKTWKIVGSEKPWLTLETDEVARVVDAIIKMKQRTREVWFIDESYSTQAEFWFQSWDVKFFQERRFLPFDYSWKQNTDNYSFNRFWNPEKLWELRVINLADIEMDSDLINDWIPSVYIPNFDMINRGSLPNFYPNNMSAIFIWNRLKHWRNDIHPWELSAVAWWNSLEHNTYRYALRAWAVVMDKSNDAIPNMKTWELIQL